MYVSGEESSQTSADHTRTQVALLKQELISFFEM